MKKKASSPRGPVQDAQVLPINPDLFLDEDALVRLAMRELNGRMPPGVFGRGGGRDPEGRDLQVHSEGPAPRRTVLAHEMEMRGWTVRELAKEAGLTASEALALARGNRRITPDVATKLARAFATSEEFWL